jgi:hypothetical protein
MKSQKAQVVMKQRLNIDLLPHVEDGNLVGCGVRVRPYGKGARTDSMLLGYGTSVEAALEDIFDKAHAGRWEPLDWAARPWTTATANTPDPIWG